MLIIAGKYTKIDPDKEMFLGHQFEKDGQRAIEKRCNYCGRYFTFDVKKYEDWGDNFTLSFNGIPEKIHCGSSHCQEYHRRVLLHQEKMKEELARKSERLFFDLMSAGRI